MKHKPRCPKCGGAPNEYREVWDKAGISFDADEAGRPADEGYAYEGYPTSVLASCGKCSWCWKLKGVTQITEVRELFNIEGAARDGEESHG